MEIDAQTAPFTTDSKEAAVVTRAKAIKLKDPGRLVSGLERSCDLGPLPLPLTPSVYLYEN